MTLPPHTASQLGRIRAQVVARRLEWQDSREPVARILGRKTDIMTRRSLHPALKQRIEASALQVF